MMPIVLTEEQESALRSTTSTVPVHNRAGRMIGVLIQDIDIPDESVKLDPEVIEILAERMSMKNIQWRTTAEVLERLDEIDRQCCE